MSESRVRRSYRHVFESGQSVNVDHYWRDSSGATVKIRVEVQAPVGVGIGPVVLWLQCNEVAAFVCALKDGK